MRTVTYGAATSLDGFITATDGALDWLHFSPDVQRASAAYLATVDTMLMGRRTWDETARFLESGATILTQDTIVFSRTLGSVDHPRVRVIASDPGDYVRDLKAQPGADICVMGGGQLASALLAAGVLDVLSLNVHPIVLGRGTPFLRDLESRVQLTLAHAQPIDGGCLLLTYHVLHEQAMTSAV